MLNPSTADALIDDATIRKCIGFAERWGYGGIDVINLFALRSRDPLGILTEPFPAKPEYMSHLFDAIKKSKLLIAAWGCESTLKKSPVLLVSPLDTNARNAAHILLILSTLWNVVAANPHLSPLVQGCHSRFCVTR